MIEIKQLSKIFKDKKALDNVDLKFEKGKITGLIGFNGSGKTTTFNILTNFLSKESGEITINGAPRDENFYRKVAYINANEAITGTLKAKDSFNYLRRIYGLSKTEMDKQVKYYTDLLECGQFLNLQMSKLSKGNQQKMRIIKNLINPEIEYLFLDEPFDGLDPLMVSKLKEIFVKMSKEITVIITSHRMDIVDDICEGYYILKDGVVVRSIANKLELSEINVEINIEVKPEDLKVIDCIDKITKNDMYNVVSIKDINNFKELSKELLKLEEYKWHSLRRQTVADAFMEEYDGK